jgi:hypothetical protein
MVKAWLHVLMEVRYCEHRTGGWCKAAAYTTMLLGTYVVHGMRWASVHTEPYCSAQHKPSTTGVGSFCTQCCLHQKNWPHTPNGPSPRLCTKQGAPAQQFLSSPWGPAAAGLLQAVLEALRCFLLPPASSACWQAGGGVAAWCLPAAVAAAACRPPSARRAIK